MRAPESKVMYGIHCLRHADADVTPKAAMNQDSPLAGLRRSLFLTAVRPEAVRYAFPVVGALFWGFATDVPTARCRLGIRQWTPIRGRGTRVRAHDSNTLSPDSPQPFHVCALHMSSTHAIQG